MCFCKEYEWDNEIYTLAAIYIFVWESENETSFIKKKKEYNKKDQSL